MQNITAHDERTRFAVFDSSLSLCSFTPEEMAPSGVAASSLLQTKRMVEVLVGALTTSAEAFPALCGKGQPSPKAKAPTEMLVKKGVAGEEAEFMALRRLDVLTPRLLRVEEGLLPLSHVEALWAWHAFALEQLRPRLLPFFLQTSAEKMPVLAQKRRAEMAVRLMLALDEEELVLAGCEERDEKEWTLQALEALGVVLEMALQKRQRGERIAPCRPEMTPGERAAAVLTYAGAAEAKARQRVVHAWERQHAEEAAEKERHEESLDLAAAIDLTYSWSRYAVASGPEARGRLLALRESCRLLSSGPDILFHDNLRNSLCALLYWHPLEMEGAASWALKEAAAANAFVSRGYERKAFEAVVATACQTHSPTLQENIVRVVLERLDTTKKPKEESMRCLWAMLAKTCKAGCPLGVEAVGDMMNAWVRQDVREKKETLRGFLKDSEGCFVDVLAGCLGPRAEEHKRSSAARQGIAILCAALATGQEGQVLLGLVPGAGDVILKPAWKRETLGAAVKAAILRLAADSERGSTKMLLRRAAVSPMVPREGDCTGGTLRADMRLLQELEEDGNRAESWVGTEDRRLLLHPHRQVLAQAQVAINAIVRAENEEGARVRLVRDKESGDWVAAGPTAEGLHEEMPRSLVDAKHIEQGENLRSAAAMCLSSAVAALLPVGSEPQRISLTWMSPPSGEAMEQTDLSEGPTCFCDSLLQEQVAVRASYAYVLGDWPQPMWIQAEAAWQQFEGEEAPSGREEPKEEESGAAEQLLGDVVWVFGERWCGGWSHEASQEAATSSWNGDWSQGAWSERWCGGWSHEASQEAATSSWNGDWSQGAWSEGWPQAEEPQWPSPEELQRIRNDHLVWAAGDDDE